MGKDKEYTNGRITVLFDMERCQHSTNCGRGLPKVFNAKRKPWVDMDAATDQEIIDQVAKCPSGALRMKEA